MVRFRRESAFEQLYTSTEAFSFILVCTVLFLLPRGGLCAPPPLSPPSTEAAAVEEDTNAKEGGRFLHGRSGPQVSVNDCAGDVFLDISVSPRLNMTVNGVLEIYWETNTVLPGDWIGLYNQNPATLMGDPIFNFTVDNQTGLVYTGIEEKRNSSFQHVFDQMCLGYWATYVRGDSGETGAVTCLSTEPRWMENSWNEISRLRLANCFLPGTHNSAAYKEIFTPYLQNIVHKYSFNQGLTVLDQLLWGTRVLDLRIAQYANTNQTWWCNHDFIRLRPLSDVLQEVKLFMDNTNEIVVLDIHNFPVGFKVASRNTHRRLLEYLENELGTYLAPASLGWGATLDSISKSGRRLILAYNSNEISAPFSWPPVVHKWGDVQDLEQLKRYFSNVFNMQVTAPWAAMVELTPKTVDLLLDRYGGLREMAAITNPAITTWFRGPWGRFCHIVSVDFIRGTSIVKTAIGWNKKRAGYFSCTLTSGNSG